MKREDTRSHTILFQPGQIRNLTVKNRLIRSATFENLATRTGEMTDDLLNLYRNLAQGEVGLIITGHVGPSEAFLWYPWLSLSPSSRLSPGKCPWKIIMRWLKNLLKLSEESGFDGVQWYAAYGHLLSGFLFPYRNRRRCKYGGGSVLSH